MEKFYLQESPKTPHLSFDPSSGIFEIRGKSIPENAMKFFQPMFDWIQGYIAQPSQKTTVTVQLDYFNTSSAKCFADLFKKIGTLHTGNTSVEIVWLFRPEDEDMEEAGNDYKSISKIPFRVVSQSANEV